MVWTQPNDALYELFEARLKTEVTERGGGCAAEYLSTVSKSTKFWIRKFGYEILDT